jgi:N-acyl-D-aspartate/D-glutamate deacylase
MGSARSKAASEDDLKAMERQVRDAIRAGAIGFTTRARRPRTPNGQPVASRQRRGTKCAGWSM